MQFHLIRLNIHSIYKNYQHIVFHVFNRFYIFFSSEFKSNINKMYIQCKFKTYFASNHRFFLTSFFDFAKTRIFLIKIECKFNMNFVQMTKTYFEFFRF